MRSVLLAGVVVLIGLAAAVAVPGRGSVRASRLRAVARGPTVGRGGISGAPVERVAGSGSVRVDARGFDCQPMLASLLERLRRRVDRVRTARQTRHRRRAAVREVCDVVAAEVRAGHSPTRALEAASGVLAELAPVAAVSRLGGDVPAALRAVDAPGAEALSRLAVAWQLAADTGAGLAAVVDRVGAGLRADEELRAEVVAQLAGPRASARMLAALPLLGLALGFGAGSDPIPFLFATPYGLACLALGAALAGAGLVWVERLARTAERAA